jgi:hypothetical protein
MFRRKHHPHGRGIPLEKSFQGTPNFDPCPMMFLNISNLEIDYLHQAP